MDMAEAPNWKYNACGRKFVASFSGGKDSTLALHHAMQAGEPVGLIVVMEEEGKRSRSHGILEPVIRAQAEAIGLPLLAAAASWEDYEQVFIRLLEQAKRQGAEVLVTGDLDMPAHGCWHDGVTRRVDLGLGMPLWERDHVGTVREFIDLGFQAILVTVNLSMGMREDDLGRVITHEFVDELAARGIDPCGESGEFHTLVVDGPIFKRPVPVRKRETIRDGEYAFLTCDLDDGSGRQVPDSERGR
jgi:Predicted ATPases of PP-loop superfamily